MPHKQKSFTLIEMLIVVVIIGILAAALIPRLQSVQARARDTKRKADLHQIGTALAIYKEDNGSFDSAYIPDSNGNYTIDPGNFTSSITSPSVITDQIGTDPTSWLICNLLTKYMTSVPVDNNTSRWGPNGQWVIGYAFAPLNTTISQITWEKTHNTWSVHPLNAFILGAKTESDGSSSNRVSTSSVDQNSNQPNRDSDGTRRGAIGSFNVGDGDTGASATIYNQYMCSKVTLDSGTTNDGNGTCTAAKDGDDLRYIYVQ